MRLGTVVKITSTVTIDDGSTADSMAITIYDPSRTALVSAAAMTTGSTGSEFYYLYQSSTSDLQGDYRAVVKATESTNYGIGVKDFSLTKILD